MCLCLFGVLYKLISVSLDEGLTKSPLCNFKWSFPTSSLVMNDSTLRLSSSSRWSSWWTRNYLPVMTVCCSNPVWTSWPMWSTVPACPVAPLLWWSQTQPWAFALPVNMLFAHCANWAIMVCPTVKYLQVMSLLLYPCWTDPHLQPSKFSTVTFLRYLFDCKKTYYAHETNLFATVQLWCLVFQRNAHFIKFLLESSHITNNNGFQVLY